MRWCIGEGGDTAWFIEHGAPGVLAGIEDILVGHEQAMPEEVVFEELPGFFGGTALWGRPEPPTVGEVAAFLAMDRTTLTANLKPLERRGLLKVTVDDADRRSRRLTLTAAGRALLVSAVPVWQRTHAAIERLLTQSDPDRLRADLRALS